MTRLATVAKEFGQKPSSYLPELGTFEAFCLDEACAHALIQMREEAREKSEIKEKPKKEEPKKEFVSIGWLLEKQEHLKKTGRFK